MTKLKKKCWEDLGWMRGDQLRAKEGNQSHAFLARRATDPEHEFNYVLKSLKRQDSQDKRAMFYVETAAMKALDHRGVLSVEGTNAEHYKESVELFLITRKATGDDFEKIVSDGPRFEDIIRIVLGVLDILKHCHSRGVVHRDIKPCHVITPNEDFDSPVLIDFGLAHCDEHQPSDAATKSGQGKGNRFLVGPEHLPGVTIANRDGATDICQCVGLLFFAITNRYPGILRDENELKPHQRSGVQMVSTIDQWKRESLELIFDKAFEWHPDKRWNDVETLRQRLRQLIQQKLSPDEMLKLRIEKAVQESHIKTKVDKLARAQHMSDQFFELARRSLSVIEEGARAYLQIQSNNQPVGGFGGIGWPATNHVLSQNLIEFRPKHRRAILVILLLTTLENSDFVATLRPYTGASKIFPNDQPVELGRCEIGDVECLNQLRSQLEQRLLICVEEMLSD